MTERPRRDEAVSLAPLDPEEALRALLPADPDDDPKDTATSEGGASEGR